MKDRSIEGSVTQIGFRDRAKTSNRARLCHTLCFIIGHMGRVDEAPARRQFLMVKQPFNRSLSGPRNAVLHFLDLFGNVNMHRCIRQKLCRKCQLIGGDSTQAVRRYAKHGTIETGKRLLAAFD
ncbi:hypothetical protein FQZ97_1039000 [compost metagenome]